MSVFDMKINSINRVTNLTYKKSDNVNKNIKKSLSLEVSKNNRAPIFFLGRSSKVTKAEILSSSGQISTLRELSDKSYLLDDETSTSLIYGVSAISFLEQNDEFEFDTQIVFPKGAEGFVEYKDKKIKISENSAVCLNKGAKAKITISKGYPLIISTKNEFNWYQKYSKDSSYDNIQNKYSDAVYNNSHHYNGEFSSDILLPSRLRNESFLNKISINKWAHRNNLINALYSARELLSAEDKKAIEFLKALVDKLFRENVIEQKEDGFLKFSFSYNDEFFKKKMQDLGFSYEEIKMLFPVYHQSRQVKMDSKRVRKNPIGDFDYSLIEKMRQRGILFDNKKFSNEHIYWRELYPNREILKRKLFDSGFCEEEVNSIVDMWEKENLSGFDVTVLKFISDKISVYNLDDKINCWNSEKTNWVTNSIMLASEDFETLSVGVSIVQTNKKGPQKMSEVHSTEALHKHINEENKKQKEVYLVTNGEAVLELIQDGKPTYKTLKEGELFIVEAGAFHCVKEILGEYEHVCIQVPSAFQYGFEFKILYN